MITLSVCMIVKNEEDVLGRCLDNVKEIADEIIIVDTGSTDKTKHIAKKYTRKVYDFEWCDDFSKARNYSFSKATKEYIMWLDADDIILEKDRIAIKNLKSTLDPNTDVVMLNYNAAFDENGEPTFSYSRERILKREKNFQWSGHIHEVITPSGNVIYNDAAITHKKIHAGDPKRNLKIYEKMLEEGITFSAREKYYYARELYYNHEYEKAVTVLEDFLNSEEGWIENNINACLDLYHCYIYLGKDKESLLSLLRSFSYDTPRAEISCNIGNYFFEKQQYNIAIFWYKLAVTKRPNTQNGGFCLIDCYGYIPYLQLCICYYKLGEYELSREYNEMAGRIKPNDKIYLKNKDFFDNSNLS
ncbi:MAG: glycosyltransferase family 2 protein [Clostridia bacterium]|nr:glycosyltransferase family 2 protein [Clostridia bacterium]